VNEGLIEWPPSPWRLVRALVACGFSSQRWTDIPPLARSLIDKLASVLPLYKLPEITAAHTRHFMPVGTVDKGREKTTLVWDTFANVGNGELFIHWPCELNSDETVLLANLARDLNYLGRGESWVQAQIVPDASISIHEFNAVPHHDGEIQDRRYEQISLMAAIPADSYQSWQREKAREAVAHLDLPGAKKSPTAKQKEKLDAEKRRLVDPYPPDLIACLTKDTSWWKGHRWSQPPGSQRVLYWRPNQSIEVTAPRKPLRQPPRPVEMMLLALTTPSGGKSALPSITRTLPQGELFHRAVVARAANGDQAHCPELTGQDQQHKPLRDHHRHAHIVTLDLNGDGHLDHVLVYAQMRLGEAAQRAIRTLRRTWTKGGTDIQLAVVASGDLESLPQLRGGLGISARRLLGRPQGSHIWESVTPFVLPRFLKPRGKNTIDGQISAELASRRLPPMENVRIDINLTRGLRHFVRCRGHGGVPPPMDSGYGLCLSLSEPVCGPLTLGYGSHFGLGLFQAVDAD